jgi:hypothetical protein
MLDFSLEKVAFSQRKSAFVDLDAGYKTAFHIGSQIAVYCIHLSQLGLELCSISLWRKLLSPRESQHL